MWTSRFAGFVFAAVICQDRKSISECRTWPMSKFDADWPSAFICTRAVTPISSPQRAVCGYFPNNLFIYRFLDKKNVTPFSVLNIASYYAELLYCKIELKIQINFVKSSKITLSSTSKTFHQTTQCRRYEH